MWCHLQFSRSISYVASHLSRFSAYLACFGTKLPRITCIVNTVKYVTFLCLAFLQMGYGVKAWSFSFRNCVNAGFSEFVILNFITLSFNTVTPVPIVRIVIPIVVILLLTFHGTGDYEFLVPAAVFCALACIGKSLNVWFPLSVAAGGFVFFELVSQTC